jgi:hypothetical protein
MSSGSYDRRAGCDTVSIGNRLLGFLNTQTVALSEISLGFNVVAELLDFS